MIRIISSNHLLLPSLPSLLRPTQFSLAFSTSSLSKAPINLSSDIYSSPSSTTTSDSDRLDGPLIILHGLYGSKQNWRSLAKTLAKRLEREVIVLDLRNHGTSPHAPEVSYKNLAEDVQEFIEKKNLKDVVLMGHSMGGKVAMTLALTDPTSSSVSKLIVVDMAPGIGKISDEFKRYLEAMKEIDRSSVVSRKDADGILEKFESDLSVRQFLLTNLERPKGCEFYKFRLPLDYLTTALEELGEFPFSPIETKWSKPALFLKGAKSKYINRHNLPLIEEFFPEMKLEILDAGHWVHAERPREFIDLVESFCKP